MSKPMWFAPFRVFVFLCVPLLLYAGCARLPDISKTEIRAARPSELHRQLREAAPQLERFRSYGPFEVTRTENSTVTVRAGERYEADLFTPMHGERAPLVIFVHGHGASKNEHMHQAMHVATWGLFALTLDLPNEGPWHANARSLERVVASIAAAVVWRDPRIDTGRIVLVGHSFGAAAVAGALAEGVPVMGAILLDPAVPERGLPRTLARIKTPVMILGADETQSQTRNRGYFFRFVRGGVFEISVRDAMHEDAQFPADEFGATEAHQITFASAICASVLSLAMAGRFDYAWSSFREDLGTGRLFNARRK